MSTLTAALIACLAVSSVFAAVFIVTREVKGGWYSLVTKTLASLMFVITGIVLVSIKGTWSQNWSVFMVLGLIFGMIGDVFLDIKRNVPEREALFLNSGMLSFGIGHVFYFLAALFYIMNFTSAVVPATVGLVGFGIALVVVVCAKFLKLNLGRFKYQSLSYLGILMYMAVMTVTAAISSAVEPNPARQVPYMWLFALGMCLFLLSDLLLSFTYFGDKSNRKMMVTMSVLNHIAYYAAQLTLCSVLYYV